MRYEDRFKTKIDIGADTAYDAFTMLANAINKTETEDPDLISTELSNTKAYEGVSGKLISDGKRGFVKDSVLMKIENGKPVKLSK